MTNEQQTITTDVVGVDEVQTVMLNATDVVNDVRRVTVSATDIDEIQTITTSGTNMDEIVTFRTSSVRQAEVQVYTITTDAEVDEVHQIALTEPYTGVAQVTTLTVQTGQTLASFQDVYIDIECPSSGAYRFGLQATASATTFGAGGSVTDVTVDVQTAADSGTMEDNIATAMESSMDAAAAGAYFAVDVTGAVMTITCVEDGAVSNTPVTSSATHLAWSGTHPTTAGVTNTALSGTFTITLDLSSCTLCSTKTSDTTDPRR